mmetsp:Transcript_16935/g.21944  ORF Transcript_16935/g.21944 Transcript_16935/m.21944 type:complete len:201 (+) Transcript_16935:335-937(+)|eukprot:CAMPEP_0197292058 /NCGR_PEP_ID=MMETSP0890-20130614/21035_1 /TAXON_ID=44058 ORGANISM="Aureoumbra lagunensis, Strain CCMP1510" /NCGR_SAMPLE_ID=MMETSP0890 /ASSEMBLY_ACC=CAM_ASM_000533 /LENGTH=200 /DNA_ID=CAMNT_0042765657 /DNA_START=117 /DNA_END=719 /DNA_ORIENTATION=-
MSSGEASLPNLDPSKFKIRSAAKRDEEAKKKTMPEIVTAEPIADTSSLEENLVVEDDGGLFGGEIEEQPKKKESIQVQGFLGSEVDEKYDDLMVASILQREKEIDPLFQVSSKKQLVTDRQKRALHDASDLIDDELIQRLEAITKDDENIDHSLSRPVSTINNSDTTPAPTYDDNFDYDAYIKAAVTENNSASSGGGLFD